MTFKTLLSRAYAPYSKKPDVCIVKGDKGGYYIGVRIENISFPLTIPAVQAACSICLSEGETPTLLYLSNIDSEQLEFWSKEFSCEVRTEIDFDENQITSLLKTKLDDENSQLQSLLKKSVTPNSDFPVSALLYVEDGYFEGVNIEVSAWSMGICAERVALAKAIAAGYKSFLDIAIHTEKGEISSPCGTCRQVLHEHIPLQKAKLHHSDGTYSEHFITDLLPFSFTSKDLRK
jgi:homotetrameric cytidine deaminase